MRSIILVVLVVLCHNAFGDPLTSSQQGEFSQYEQSGGKQIYLSSEGDDDTDIDYSEHQHASSQQGEFKQFQQTGGKPIYLTSQGTDRLFQRPIGKPAFLSSEFNNHREIDADDEEEEEEAVSSRRILTAAESQIESQHGHHDFNEDFSLDVNTDKADCNCKGNKGKPRITYGPEQIVKGRPETYIHHQPKIIVRQPPTHVRIEHPPTIIHPSSIVFRRHGKTIRRPVVYQHLPQDVQVRPVYVKVIKPIEKKVLIGEEKLPCDKVAKEFKGQLGDEVFDSYSGESFSESLQQKESLSGRVNIKERTQYSK